MQQKQQRKKSNQKQKNGQKMKTHHELGSWTEIISEKILTDYALPITKNAEARLHQLNEKLENVRA